MRERRVVGMVLVVLAGIIAMSPGCAGLENALSGVQKPSASVKSARLANLSPDGVDLVFDVDLKNPYGVELPLAGLDYSLAARSTTFLTGNAPLSGTVPANGSRVVQVPARVAFSDLLNTVSGVRLGQVVPYKADLGLSVNVPSVGGVAAEPLRVPVSHSGEVPVPNVPGVELTGVKWGKVSFESASATLSMRLTNTNEFPINVKKFQYGLGLDGSDVFGGEVSKALSLRPGEAGVVEIPVTASASKALAALVGMMRKSDAGYQLRGAAEVGTPFGDVSLPFDRAGSAALTR